MWDRSVRGMARVTRRSGAHESRAGHENTSGPGLPTTRNPGPLALRRTAYRLILKVYDFDDLAWLAEPP